MDFRKNKNKTGTKSELILRFLDNLKTKWSKCTYIKI